MSKNERVLTTSNTPVPQTPAVSASALTATPRPQLEAQGVPRKFTPLLPVSDELHSRLNALATSSLSAQTAPETAATATSATSASTTAPRTERATALSPAHTLSSTPSSTATAKSDAEALESNVTVHASEGSKYLSAFTRATTHAQLAAATATTVAPAAPAALAAPAATIARTALPYDHTPARMEHVQVLQQALGLLQQQLKTQRHAALQAVAAPAASACAAEAQPATSRLPQPQPLNPYLPLNADVDPLKDCPSCLLLALHTSSRAAIARLLACSSQASATTASTPTMAKDAVPSLDVLQTALRCITAQLGTTELTTALHRVFAPTSDSTLALGSVAADLSTSLGDAQSGVSTTMLRATDTMRRAVAKMTVQLAAQFISHAVATAPAVELPVPPSTAEELTNIILSAIQTLFAVVGAPCPQLLLPQQQPLVKLTAQVADALKPQLLIGLTLWLERYESQIPQLKLPSTCDFAVAVPLLAPVEQYRDFQQRAVALLAHAPTEVQHLWYQSQHLLVQHEQQLYTQNALTATQSYQFLALQQAAQAMRPFYHLFCRYEGTVSRPEMALLRLYHLFYEQEGLPESSGTGAGAGTGAAAAASAAARAIIPYQWANTADDQLPAEYYWFFVDLSLLVDRSHTDRTGLYRDHTLQSLQSCYLNCHLYYDADLFTEWSQKLEPASAQLLSAHELSLLSGLNVMPQLDHSTAANHAFLSAHYSLLHNQGDAYQAGMVLELASQMPLTENWQILSGQALRENKTFAALLQEQDARNQAQQQWLKRRASEERRSHEQARHEQRTNFQSKVPLPPLLQGRARPGPKAGVLLPPAPLQPVSIPLSYKQAQLLLQQMQLLKSATDLNPEELHQACTAIRENCFWRFHQVVGLLGDTLCGLKPYVVDFNPTHELRFINEQKLFFGTKTQGKGGNFLTRQHLVRMSAWWQALRAQQERPVAQLLKKSYPPLFLHISNKHLAEPWQYCQVVPAAHAASIAAVSASANGNASASASTIAASKAPVFGNLSLNDGYNQHLYYGGLKVTTGFTLDSADLNAIAGYKQRHSALQHALAFASQSLSHFSAMLLQKQSLPLFFCLEDLLLQSHQPAPIFAHCHTLVALQLETVLSCGLKMSLAAYYTNISPSWLYRLSKERPCNLDAPDFHHTPDSTIAQMLAQLTLAPAPAAATTTVSATAIATTAPEAMAPKYSQHYLDEFGSKRLKQAALSATAEATPAPRSGCGTAPSKTQCEMQHHEALSALELQTLKSQQPQPQPVSAPQQWEQQLTARDKSRARAAALAAAATAAAQGWSPAAPAAPVPRAANTLTIMSATPAATAAVAAAQATAPRIVPAPRNPAGSKHRTTNAALYQRQQHQHQQQSTVPTPSLWQQAYGQDAQDLPSLQAPLAAASALAPDTVGTNLRDYARAPSLSVVTQLQDQPILAEVEPRHTGAAVAVPMPPKPAAPALRNHRKQEQQTKGMGMALTAPACATGAAMSPQGGAAMQTLGGNGGGSVAPAAVFMNSMWPPLGMSRDLNAKQRGALLYAATHRVSAAAPTTTTTPHAPATPTAAKGRAPAAVRAPTAVLAPAEAKALLRLSNPNQLQPRQQQPQQPCQQQAQQPRQQQPQHLISQQLPRSTAPAPAAASIPQAAATVVARATAATIRQATMGVTSTLTAMMPHHTTGSLLTANELGLEAEQLHYTTPEELESLANDVHRSEATPPTSTSKEERLEQLTTASVYKGICSAKQSLASEVAKALQPSSTPQSEATLKPKEIAALKVQECNDLYTILQLAPLNIMLNTMVNMYFKLLQVHGLLYDETVEFTSSSLESSTYPAQIELVHQLLLERQEAQLVGSSLAYDETTHKVRLHLSFLHHDRERKELNLRAMLNGSSRKGLKEHMRPEQESARGSAEDSAIAEQDTAASPLLPQQQQQQQQQLTKLLRTARQQEAFAEVLPALEFFATQHELTLEEAATRIGFMELFAQAKKAHLVTADDKLHTLRSCSVVAQSTVATLASTALSSAPASQRLHEPATAAYRNAVAALTHAYAHTPTQTQLVPAATELESHKAKQQSLRSSNIPSTDELALFSLPRNSLEARLKAQEAKQRSEPQQPETAAAATAPVSAIVSAAAPEKAAAPAAGSVNASSASATATVNVSATPEQSAVPFTPLHRATLTTPPVTDPNVTQALAALKVQVQQRLHNQNLLLASTPLQQEALLDFVQSKGLQSPAELGMLYGLCAALAQTASTKLKQSPLLSGLGLNAHRAPRCARCYHARQSLRGHFTSSELHVHTTHCTPRTGTGAVTPLVATQKRQLQEAMLTWLHLQELGLGPILEAYELNMACWCEWYLSQRSAEQRLRLADFMALLEKKSHEAATTEQEQERDAPVKTTAQSRKAKAQARQQSKSSKARPNHSKFSELNHNLEKLAAAWGITKENQQRAHELKISYLEFYTRFLLGCQTGEQGAMSSVLKGQWVLYQMKNHQRYELWGLTHDCLRFGRTEDNDASWDKKSWPQRLLHPEGYHGAIDLFLAAAVYKGVRQLEQTLLFPEQSKRLLLLKSKEPLPEKLLCPSFEVFLYALEALESQEAMWYQCTCGHRNLVFNPYLGHTRLTEQNCEQCATHLVL